MDPGTRFQGVVQGVFFLILTLGWTSPPAFDKLALWMLSLLLEALAIPLQAPVSGFSVQVSGRRNIVRFFLTPET
ncbi:MAG: hypothetical protein WCG22_03075 [Lentisphaerota bacterium]